MYSFVDSDEGTSATSASVPDLGSTSFTFLSFGIFVGVDLLPPRCIKKLAGSNIQSISQSINQSINQSIVCPINRPGNQLQSCYTNTLVLTSMTNSGANTACSSKRATISSAKLLLRNSPALRGCKHVDRMLFMTRLYRCCSLRCGE